MADFVTIGVYETLPDAHIALGRLQVEGIDAWLADAHFVQMDWLYSIALGGIKLQVSPADKIAALRILATDYSGELDETAS